MDFDLETIRTRAKELGVAFHPAQKAETIQQNIDKFLSEKETLETKPAPKQETPEEAEARHLQEAVALIPITVTSMDPADAQTTGVLVSVGNRKLGQITKAIPFGYKWYMPKILVQHMEAQMFCRSSMVPTGVPGTPERLNTQWLKKYAIQYHPMPTQEELEELAKLQLQGNELAK
jgi:restriction endonuclease S subunit